MKAKSLAFIGALLFVVSGRAQVRLNEIFFNPVGTDAPHEYFEVRGTPSLALSGYYLLGVEGDVASNPGDVQDIFDLGAFSLGGNGFLVGFQKGTLYSGVASGATAFTNSGTGAGWGSGASSSIGHNADSGATDGENPSATYMLVNIGAGVVPDLLLDLDSNDDGAVDSLPAAWTVLDSVGFTDASTDISYGAITFRATGLGIASGTVVDLSFAPASQYFGRKGNSTGSTADDWLLAGTQGTGPDFTFSNTQNTDSSFAGQPISVMQPGGPNAIPEPGALALLAIGLGLTVLLRARRRRCKG